ncbi:GntR family transcriptional regulator [Mycolicibacterium goodii]|uniref:GntR family transcriptional regulator n=1 Tax=Mycolicibacterium goodii TaxID=134601 RepID=A0ABS6HP91_MYCGD|nr:GntR family transcriptional regulator [Mycolicibacterium goodii]MBU8809874.1 GntR family transcriptional regulator [Mycolicibacterium goodii]MBU8823087.1 GntR family transcriptional regulator [Mycolicibacterium goodii]MBU8831182.1 GntR family transcriptional regulator [Mycolicibacterium goodii]MBU8837472.1 GntR family transcriptional regulator [Mycolicibacterium goodii]PJK22892.1 GntR family transcriptional regulator [Mycolicibacterium goodii]
MPIAANEPSAEPATPLSARDRVYEWVRDEIIKGALPAGRFLDEVWVSELVGTSRTPVREAFHRLNSEKFIDLLPRRGAQVRNVTAREMEEVYASRRLIEGHAACALCTARAGAPTDLETLAGQMEEAGRAEDWFTVARLDRAFHRAIVDAHGNSVLTELYDALQSRQQRVAVRALQIRPQRVPEIDRQHRAIIAALAHNSVDEVAALLDEHLRPIPEITAALG